MRAPGPTMVTGTASVVPREHPFDDAGNRFGGMARSWSYLRHPSVLAPRLRRVALPAFLADGAPPRPQADGRAMPGGEPAA